jgi:hypothetical protein
LSELRYLSRGMRGDEARLRRSFLIRTEPVER